MPDGDAEEAPEVAPEAWCGASKLRPFREGFGGTIFSRVLQAQELENGKKKKKEKKARVDCRSVQ